MTYTVNWTKTGTSPNGKPAITLPQLTVDSTSTSLTLTGKGTPNYGEIQQENFIRLLENFASSTAPAYPTYGQLWYNTTDNAVYVYDTGSDWKRVGDIVKSASAPTGASEGDIWWDTTNNVLFVYSGSDWAQIWPSMAIVPVAYVEEYNKLVDQYNRIAGTASQNVSGGADITIEAFSIDYNGTITKSQVAFNSVIPNVTYGTYYGYGQTNLAHATQATLTNDLWVSLLDKFKKLANHQGTPTTGIGNRGFILDGATQQGVTSCLDEFKNFKSAANTIELNRFKVNPLSLENDVLANSSFTRTSSYFYIKSHEVVMTFTSTAQRNAFFNAGGKFNFSTSFNPGQTTAFNSDWQDFIASIGVISFTAGTDAAAIAGITNGLYNLSTSYKTLVLRTATNGAAAGAYYKIEVRSENSGQSLRFKISFAPEGINDAGGSYSASEYAAIGSTVSTVTTFKPNSTYLDLPVVSYPTDAQEGTFITDNAL